MSIDIGISAVDVAIMYGLKPKNGFITCPFHEDKHPSLKLYPGSRGFYCFGCRRGGDVMQFIMDLHGVSFRKAKAIVKRDFGIDLGGRGRVRRRSVDKIIAGYSDEFLFQSLYKSYELKIESDIERDCLECFVLYLKGIDLHYEYSDFDIKVYKEIKRRFGLDNNSVKETLEQAGKIIAKRKTADELCNFAM